MIKYNSENIVKHEIIKFLKLFKKIDLKTSQDFIVLIKGGCINGIRIEGFIKLKEKILNIMKQSPNTKSSALTYIENHIK
jgi:hypothetical protein